MIDTLNLIAISAKGKSRIGAKLITAIVEQINDKEAFIVIYGPDRKVSQARWIKLSDDPDYRIIPED